MLASLEYKEERKYIPPHHSYSAHALHSPLLLPLTHSLPFPPPSPSPLLPSSHTCIIFSSFSNLTYIRLNAGIPSLNCSINQAKGRANFKLSEGGNILFDKDGKGGVRLVPGGG